MHPHVLESNEILEMTYETNSTLPEKWLQVSKQRVRVINHTFNFISLYHENIHLHSMDYFLNRAILLAPSKSLEWKSACFCCWRLDEIAVVTASRKWVHRSIPRF
jgi:hypothetical protein